MAYIESIREIRGRTKIQGVEGTVMRKALGQIQFSFVTNALLYKAKAYGYPDLLELLDSAMQNDNSNAPAIDKLYADIFLRMAGSYMDNKSATPNIAEAEKLLQKALEKDSKNVDVHYLFADLKEKQKQYAEAITFYEQASEKGSGEAAYKLGSFYEKGTYVQKNIKTAVSWYKKSAMKDINDSDLKLMALDPKGAFAFYSDLHKTGNVNAMVSLAKMYKNGQGTTVDSDKAMGLFMEAKRNGSAQADKLIKEECAKVKNNVRILTSGMYSNPNPYRAQSMYDFINKYCN